MCLFWLMARLDFLRFHRNRCVSNGSDGLHRTTFQPSCKYCLHFRFLPVTQVDSTVLPVSFFDYTPSDSRFCPLETGWEYWTCVKIVIYWSWNQLFGSRSLVKANLSNKIAFLSAYFRIHGTSVPQEVTQDSFHRTQRIRITSSVTQDGVLVLVVYCLSFRCQTMNYALLRFLWCK